VPHEDSLNYWDIFAMISQEFPITRICHSKTPLMPGGLVTLIFGSRQDDPMTTDPRYFMSDGKFNYSEMSAERRSIGLTRKGSYKLVITVGLSDEAKDFVLVFCDNPEQARNEFAAKYGLGEKATVYNDQNSPS
jgi:hypothetical protein